MDIETTKFKHVMKTIVIFAALTSLPFAFFEDTKGCEFLIQMVPDDPPVTLKFTGRETRACHQLAAICADALAKNCELCATVVGNNDSDCSVQLEFKQDVFKPTERNETCLERDIEPYCSTFFLGMNITRKNNSLTSASFDIILTANIPADRYKTNWGLIGGIIGGVIFGITAIVFVVLWIIGTCRKYRGGEQRHSPGSTAPLKH